MTSTEETNTEETSMEETSTEETIMKETSTEETVKKNGLNIWYYKSDAEVDIIAVQGLGANPFKTWVYDPSYRSPRMGVFSCFKMHANQKSEEKVMWLSDLLPRSSINAVIASFSYESAWMKSRSQTSLRDYAELLLNVLLHHRSNRGKRPLILIGHSLGGLVVQEALVTAVKQEVFAEIRLCVGGIIFLGVPFQGSSIARFGKWITRVLQGNTTLLRSLRRNSQELYYTSSDFWASYKDLDMVCFYETRDRAFGFWKTRVVDMQSAALIGKRRIPLNATHSGLNKFAGFQDENFQLVFPEIKRMAKYDRHRRKDSSGTDEVEPCSTIPVEDKEFVGRGDILRRLKGRLAPHSGHRRAALVGEGGLGKTKIAIEFAIRRRRKVPRTWVFWVQASSAATFAQSYRIIAETAKIPGRRDPKVNILDLVSRWLRKKPSCPWLMIVDGCDEAELFPQEPSDVGRSTTENGLSGYIPAVPNSTVIVTTRDGQIGSRLCVGEENIKVKKMAREDARNLLRRKLQDQTVDEKTLDSLAAELGYLPLAMTQAAAYILESELSVEDYLEHFKDSDSSRTPIPTVGKLSFDFVKSEFPKLRSKPPARELLSLMCFFNCHGIPRQLLLDKEDNPVKFTMALILLRSLQLITTHKSGESFEMHPLVQDSTKRQLEPNETQTYSGQALELVSKAFPTGEHEELALCQQLLPHAEAVLAEASRRNSLHRAELLENVSRFHRTIGQYKKAEELANEASECVRGLPARYHDNKETKELKRRIDNLKEQISEGNRLGTFTKDLDQRLGQLNQRFNVLDEFLSKRFNNLDEDFNKLNQRFDKLDEDFNKLSQRFNVLNEFLNERFNKLDEDFNKLSQRFSVLNGLLSKRFDNIDWEFKKLNQRFDVLDQGSQPALQQRPPAPSGS